MKREGDRAPNATSTFGYVSNSQYKVAYFIGVVSIDGKKKEHYQDRHYATEVMLLYEKYHVTTPPPAYYYTKDVVLLYHRWSITSGKTVLLHFNRSVTVRKTEYYYTTAKILPHYTMKDRAILTHQQMVDPCQSPIVT